MKHTIFAFSLLAYSATAMAQESKACNALLDHGIYNISTTTSASSAIRLVHDDYCRVSYDSMTSRKQAAFEVVIKKLPLGGSVSADSTKDSHQKFCRDYESFASDRTLDDARVLQIYDQALEAWRDCLQLALGGTVIRPSITPNQREIDFTLSVTSGEALFTGIDVTNMSCVMEGRELTADEQIPLTANAQSLRCTRTSKSMKLGNSLVDYFPDANIKVKTNTGDYRVDLYEMLDGAARDRFERLEAEVLGLRSELEFAISSLGEPRGGQTYTINGPRIGGADSHECPAGTFVSAIHASGSIGGRYGVDGISEITFTCSEITPNE